MAIPHSITMNKSQIGTCPHGLPQGACPVCSGMGGSGGGSSKKVAKNSGEMSWDECYAQWQQILRTQEMSKQRAMQAIQSQNQLALALKPELINQKVLNFSEKMLNFSGKIADAAATQKFLPKLISKTAANLISTVAKFTQGVLNIAQNITNFVQNTASFINEKLVNISDKLSAIFGELKNSKEKKISDKLKDFKKKIKLIFFEEEITEVSETDKLKTNKD